MNQKHGRWEDGGKVWEGNWRSADDRNPGMQNANPGPTSVDWDSYYERRISDLQKKLDESVPRVNAIIVALSCMGFGIGVGFTVAWRLFG